MTAAIIGPRTMEQLESQLGAADVTLDDALLDRIDEIVAPGTTINPVDAGWTNPALSRRRAAGSRQMRMTLRACALVPQPSSSSKDFTVPSNCMRSPLVRRGLVGYAVASAATGDGMTDGPRAPRLGLRARLHAAEEQDPEDEPDGRRDAPGDALAELRRDGPGQAPETPQPTPKMRLPTTWRRSGLTGSQATVSPVSSAGGAFVLRIRRPMNAVVTAAKKKRKR